jgi:hypothetical protein
MAPRSSVALTLVLVPVFLGCTPPPPDKSATSHLADVVASGPPSDPNTMITVTVVGSDGHGGRTVIARHSTTKGEYWLAAQAALRGREHIGDVEVIKSAAAIETCMHGSQIVLYDQLNFQGNVLCFTDDGNQTPYDLCCSISFQPKSYYTIVPACIFDSSLYLLDEWHSYAFHSKSPLLSSGYPVEYIQTPGNDGNCTQF